MKADERGVYIANKVLRSTWIFHSVALVVWGIVELAKNGTTSVFSTLLFILSVDTIVFWSFYLFYQKKTSG